MVATGTRLVSPVTWCLIWLTVFVVSSKSTQEVDLSQYLLNKFGEGGPRDCGYGSDFCDCGDEDEMFGASENIGKIFTGGIPEKIADCWRLTTIDLSGHKLSVISS